MNEERRAVLMQRLDRFPLLQMLLLETRFRVALLLLAGGLAAGLFLVSKIWRVTPADFSPRIRISGLDWIQSLSLARSARASTAAGRFDEAAFAWQAAIANNPGNVEFLRGALENELKAPATSPAGSRVAMRQGIWLLRLGGTNANDALLVARICEKYQWYQWMEMMLSSAPIGGEGALLRLKAAFYQRDREGFPQLWTQNEGLRRDPEAVLFHDAYLAAWGSFSDALGATARLKAAVTGATASRTAGRLLLAVHAERGDASGYGEALERSRQFGEIAVGDEARYWHLLWVAGRRAEALARAQPCTHEPRTLREVALLAQAYQAIGLEECALECWQKQAPVFSYVPELWINWATMVIDLGRWDDLGQIALEARRLPDGPVELSYFLEGYAAMRQQRTALADKLFAQTIAADFSSPVAGLWVARSFLILGRPADAAVVLRKLEAAVAGSAAYWLLALQTAHQIKDIDWVLRAVERAMKLHPANVAVRNNYAAALLVARRNPAKAIEVTFPLLERHPASATARINHCFALLANQRIGEAKQLFRTVETRKLSPAEASAHALCGLELFLATGEWSEARRARERVDPSQLYPRQAAWLAQADRQLSEVAK